MIDDNKVLSPTRASEIGDFTLIHMPFILRTTISDSFNKHHLLKIVTINIKELLFTIKTDNSHNQYDQNEWPVESLSTHIPQISSVNEMYPYHNEELSQIALESPLPSPDLLTMTALPV
ncbi:unnamed protein product [Rhizophagus irregularis]|nr:unnamed protein product [Rhizophagus irregularis]CAB5375081.1 unnamed protein product [Rhizophagus irregularis]